MKLVHSFRKTAFLFAAVISLSATTARAEEGDALIQHNLGLAEKARGNSGTAYDLFKKACMASEGIADACMEWGKLAMERGNTKDVKRAFGSAVMLAPQDIEARFELAMMLLEKGDWVWAIEHLTEALPHTANTEDGALVRYYLGYAEFKNGALDSATTHLAQADRYLPPEVAQKARYYRGLIARQQGETDKAVALMERAQEGPDEEVSESALSAVGSWSSFSRLAGWQAQAMFSLGINTHALSDFVDESDLSGNDHPTLQSEFRGDVMVGSDTGYADGFFGGLTIYRQEYWTRLGVTGPEWVYSPEDMNFTMLLLQGSYVGHRRKWGVEHELKLGMEADLQFLDHSPVYDEQRSEFVPSDDTLVLLSRTIAAKAWWSMARDESSIWGLRFRLDVMDNQITPDMSAMRLRLRLTNTREFLDRTLQLKVLLGGRYDRSFKDQAIIKYDRLRPELWVDLRWTTPWKRLSLLTGGKLTYNWYMNSDATADNPGNSFRPLFLVPQYPDDQNVYSDEENARFERDYYMLKRHDFEWEVLAEAHVRLWTRATLALKYKHRQRLSNIDSAPVPRDWNEETGRYEDVLGARIYGYDQDLIMLELRQAF